MTTETLSKLYLELSQLLPDTKTAKEIELEEQLQLIRSQDVLTVGKLFLYDPDKGWAEVSSGLHQDFQGGFSRFNVKHKDGTEYMVRFKIKEI